VSEIKIDEIRRQLADISQKSKLEMPPEEGRGSFSQVLRNAVAEVNNDQVKTDEAIRDYLSGRETNLHHTLLSLEKADISFKLMMQLRNKLLDVYNEIMRTSV